jgi:hypothetical protein
MSPISNKEKMVSITSHDIGDEDAEEDNDIAE